MSVSHGQGMLENNSSGFVVLAEWKDDWVSAWMSAGGQVFRVKLCVVLELCNRSCFSGAAEDINRIASTLYTLGTQDSTDMCKYVAGTVLILNVQISILFSEQCSIFNPNVVFFILKSPQHKWLTLT